MREFKPWEPSDESELTLGVMGQIIWNIRDGEQDPVQTRRLLQHFVECVESGEKIPWSIVEYLRDAFKSYLANPADGTLERAMGLRRPKKRPKIQQQKHVSIARAVWRRLLAGEKRESACLAVSGEFHISAQRVGDAFDRNKGFAFTCEQMDRAMESPDQKAHWTAEERKVIHRLIGVYQRN